MLTALALGLVHGRPPPRHHLRPSRAAQLRCMEDVSLTDKIAATTDSAKAFSDEPAVIDADAATVADVEKPGATSVGDSGDEERRAALITDLLALAAGSCRGEAASESDLKSARSLVAELEALNPTPEPTLSPLCEGTWELVFSDTQLFRSSPFFMAGRAVCEDGAQAAQYDWFCDMHRAALAISTIGKVRQIVGRGSVVSEFEVSAGAVPFLSDALPFLRYSGGMPLAVSGAIVSTASVESNLGDAWRLLMDTVEIKGSNVPLLRQALDAGLRLQTRDLGSALEATVPQYANPRPKFQTSYLDGSVRVSRDQDGKLFVYRKESGEASPTEYSAVAADLGVGALMEGMARSFMGS